MSKFSSNLFPFLTFLFFISCRTYSQADENNRISFNMLLPPASPGFVLMGKEPASVERPGSVSDFAVNVLNQTENFTIVPLNYSVEAAPYWLIGAPNLTFEEYGREGSVADNFLQTLSISLATSTKELSGIENSSVTSAAAGIRFSFLRGSVDPKFNDYSARLDSITAKMETANTIFHTEIVKRKENDPVLDSLKQILINPQTSPEEIKLVEEKLRLRNEQIESEISADLNKTFLLQAEAIRKTVSTLQLRRIGWKLDFAGGVLFDFLQQKFNKGEPGRFGFWLSGGYEWTSCSALGLLRFLNMPKNPDWNSLDIGGRFIYDNLRRFAFSAEGIYRKYSGPAVNPQWRAALIIDYYFGENKKISFTFGKNFEGTPRFGAEGDLISALNLLLGFGTERPVE